MICWPPFFVLILRENAIFEEFELNVYNNFETANPSEGQRVYNYARGVGNFLFHRNIFFRGTPFEFLFNFYQKSLFNGTDLIIILRIS